MKLVDLSPRWLSKDVLMFKSPSGAGNWLTCKRVPMSFKDQCKLIYEDNPDLKGQVIVTTKDDQAWAFSSDDLNTISITPSIDASASGNWHGFITNGQVA
jgi:tricorn protease-like protein